ncbi:carbohydrate porin [Xanthomonas theicola]|uniref:Carbohydrate porin n=2 Tax=Xanthomonas theicola TaxID=56464 RepID=A0A2S6ZF14_9XANT|nr:carbohydrate porin [Xanthomonas theicola]QNH27145.1 carbohydrate porin [Xanthomonas theicola]
MSASPRPSRLLLVAVPLALPAAAAAQSAANANAYAGNTLTGDWGGTRSAWAANGVSVRGDYVGEALGVTDGGYGRTGARYAQQLRLGLDLDMGKLAGWDGGAFRFTLNDRRGRSASVDLIGNRFPVQEAYGGQYTRLSEFSYDQTFAGGTYFKLGYYAMGNQFGLLGAGTSVVNAAFCAHPLAMSGNSGWYNYPVARWGGEVAQQVSPALNLRVGWFQVNPNLAGDNVHNAFRPFVGGTTGGLFPVELTWTPGKGTRHAGMYTFGGYYDASRVPRKGLDSRDATGRHGAYLLAEQKLYSETADPARGFSVFGEYMQSDRATAQIRRWYALGGIYQGIGARSQDRIALGYVGGDINRTLVDARRAWLVEVGVPADSPLYALSGAEELYELSYSFQATPWLMLRPDVQYMVNPGTFAYRQTDDAWVVGLQAKVTF